MRVDKIIDSLGAEILVGGDLAAEATGCYVSDLLSDVLANSKTGDLWITQHTHPNVAAVAAVKGLSCVVIIGGKKPDEETLARAKAEQINMAAAPSAAFEVAGKVYMLLQGQPKENA